jgi:hypothetical protein
MVIPPAGTVNPEEKPKAGISMFPDTVFALVMKSCL